MTMVPRRRFLLELSTRMAVHLEPAHWLFRSHETAAAR